jgi:ankyrin repeat protein
MLQVMMMVLLFATSLVSEALFQNDGEGFVPVGKNEKLRALLAEKPKLDLFETAALGDAKELRKLLAKDAKLVHARNEFGWTPLHMAAFAGNVPNIALLLERGADIHSRAQSRFRNTPLQVALLTGEYDAAKLLLERGADPLDRQAGGFAPIHEAAFLGRVDLIELLLAHGAEVKARSNDGRTALSEAERGKHEEAAALLRAKGAE